MRLATLLVAVAFTLGATTPPPPQPPVEVKGTVKGVLRQVGNAPFVEVVVTGHSKAFGKGDYRLRGALAKEIQELPLGPITVRGTIRKTTLRLAGNSGLARTRFDIEATAFKR